MTLWAESAGDGADVVLLHGWGLHSGVMLPLASALRDRFRVTCVDLPGHGGSAGVAPIADLAALADTVGAVAPARAAWIGWSLGALVCLERARRSAGAVTRLVLIGATPRFTIDSAAPRSWPWGVAPTLLSAFERELARDFRGTVRRFIALQALGDTRAAAVLHELRSAVAAASEPDPAGLRVGLELLHHADLRGSLAAIAQPVLAISGERDRVTHPEAARWMAERLPRGQFQLIPGAGHAPFLTHPDEVADAVAAFVAGDEDGR